MERREKLLLKPTEVAEILSIGKSKCYQLISAGTIPSVRIGESLRIPVAQLEQWIEATIAKSGCSPAGDIARKRVEPHGWTASQIGSGEGNRTACVTGCLGAEASQASPTITGGRK